MYVVYFKTNRKCLREFPNLFNYTKDVYQFPGVAETVNMQHIKMVSKVVCAPRHFDYIAETVPHMFANRMLPKHIK